MSQYYILVKDGVATSHPITEENILISFPRIDFDNLPDNIAKFEYRGRPPVGAFEVYEEVKYKWDPKKKVFFDVHKIRPMNEEELQEEKEKSINFFNETYGYKSWVWEDETFSMEAPFDKPKDGKNYEWNEDIENWVEIEE